MVRVEKVRGNRVNVRGIGHFEIGDQEDVSPGDAEYLVEERGDFEYVDEDADVEEPEAPDEAEDENGPPHPEEAEEVLDEGDAEEAEETRPEDDAAHLAEQHWQHAVSAVEDGEADDYLDELEDVDDRDSVQSAIEERCTELGR